MEPSARLHTGDIVEVLMLTRKPTQPRNNRRDVKEPSLRRGGRTGEDETKRSADGGSEEDLSVPKELEDDVERVKKSILYKNDDIIAINKYTGLAVQGGSRTHVHVDKLAPYLRFGAEENPRLVHRLDKDATGILILARTKSAAARLQKYFAGHNDRLEKKYLALLTAPINPSPEFTSNLQKSRDTSKSEGGENGKTQQEAEKEGEGRKDVKVISTGITVIGQAPNEKMKVEKYHPSFEDPIHPEENPVKLAVTNYHVIESNDIGTVVELWPRTGRKHQLRVHCAQALNGMLIRNVRYSLLICTD
ncbi:Mitochondrial RNA pseudouridine synthase rpusd4 [Quaeritorhiza haematococci]|nr:Mitochondrial RNA pseudouridine synthase rpusd4 [Quaeritorhiza haematococci]